MKAHCFFLFVFFIAHFQVVSAQGLQKDEYQRDFDFFQTVFEKTNSGLYRYHTKTEVDSLFQAQRKKITAQTSYRDFYQLLWKVIDFTGSLHNNLDYPDSLQRNLKKENIFFPLPLRYMEGALLVNAPYKGLQVGDQILSINGIDSQVFAQDVGQFRSTDGYNTTGKYAALQTQKLADYSYLAYGRQKEFILRYSSKGSIKSIRLAATDHSTFEKQYEKRSRLEVEQKEQNLYFFEFLESDIGYLRVSSFAIGREGSPAYKDFAAFLGRVFKELKQQKTQNLIVDIRGNGGGIDPCELLLYSYMTSRKFRENTQAYTRGYHFPFPEQLRLPGTSVAEQVAEAKKRFTRPQGDRYYQNPAYNPVWKPHPDRFKHHIYVLIDPFVASAASHYAAMMKSDRKAVLIGQETSGGYYGHTGHYNITYQLPHTGLSLSFSVVNLEQDVRELSDQKPGRGIIPDHTVEQRLEDYIEQKDRVLNYTLNQIRNRN